MQDRMVKTAGHAPSASTSAKGGMVVDDVGLDKLAEALTKIAGSDEDLDGEVTQALEEALAEVGPAPRQGDKA